MDRYVQTLKHLSSYHTPIQEVLVTNKRQWFRPEVSNISLQKVNTNTNTSKGPRSISNTNTPKCLRSIPNTNTFFAKRSIPIPILAQSLILQHFYQQCATKVKWEGNQQYRISKMVLLLPFSEISATLEGTQATFQLDVSIKSVLHRY